MTYSHLEALRVFIQSEGLREVTGDEHDRPMQSEQGAANVVRLPNGQLEFATFPKDAFVWIAPREREE